MFAFKVGPILPEPVPEPPLSTFNYDWGILHGAAADDTQRLQAKLSEMKIELERRMHAPIPEVGRWLRAVVSGHFRYYGVPMNTPALQTFRFQIGRLWHRALSRRSQNGRVTWDRMRRLIDRWLPSVRVHHPYPLRRLGVLT